MKSVYERTTLIITEFNTEDVITTSGTPEPPAPTVLKKRSMRIVILRLMLSISILRQAVGFDVCKRTEFYVPSFFYMLGSLCIDR